jgi:hypothetical protein
MQPRTGITLSNVGSLLSLHKFSGVFAVGDAAFFKAERRLNLMFPFDAEKFRLGGVIVEYAFGFRGVIAIVFAFHAAFS